MTATHRLLNDDDDGKKEPENLNLAGLWLFVQKKYYLHSTEFWELVNKICICTIRNFWG